MNSPRLPRNRALLAKGAAAELEATSDNGSIVPLPSPELTTTVTTGETMAAGTARPGEVAASSTGSDGVKENAVQGARRFLRAVGKGLQLSGLRPCTAYRLTLEVPPIIREELLESARWEVGNELRK